MTQYVKCAEESVIDENELQLCVPIIDQVIITNTIIVINYEME